MAASTVCRLKSVCFVAMLFFSSLFGALVFGGCLLPVFFLRPVRYRQLFDYMIGIWLWMAAAMLEMLIGLDVTVTGDEMQANEPSIIIMNHRTRLDWMYFWCALARQPSGIMTEKIILKAPLKHIPGPGWAMQVASFMFVKRRWNEDKEYLTAMLNYFTNINYMPQILIFPEGTDYNNETSSRSDQYAKKNGLQCFRHVLQPRTTGFAFLVDHVRRSWPNAAVYDVTLGYSGRFPQNESELIAGKLPESVRFHIRRYSIAEDIPAQPVDVEQWLRSRWLEKDDRMDRFFQAEEKFIGEESSCSRQSQSGVSDWIHIYYGLSVAFWLAFDVFFVVGLLSCSALWCPMLVVSAFFLVVGSKFGGFELFQARYTASKMAVKIE